MQHVEWQSGAHKLQDEACINSAESINLEVLACGGANSGEVFAIAPPSDACMPKPQVCYISVSVTAWLKCSIPRLLCQHLPFLHSMLHLETVRVENRQQLL